MLFTTFYLTKINLSISIPYPSPVLWQTKKKHSSVVICVLYNVMLWNISFPGWGFSAFYGLYQKLFFLSPRMVEFPNFEKTSAVLISLANALAIGSRPVAGNGLILKKLSHLPQKAPSRRVHATARFVHDYYTTVTNHTDQETQFSFGTTWTLLGTFV